MNGYHSSKAHLAFKALCLWYDHVGKSATKEKLVSALKQCGLHRAEGKLLKSGADPGFQVRGSALKKNPAERREARKFLGYFVWKITILRKKSYFFPILGGARAGCAPPPGSAPESSMCYCVYIIIRSVVVLVMFWSDIKFGKLINMFVFCFLFYLFF